MTSEDGRRSIGARRNPASADAILAAAVAVLSDAGHSGFSIEAVAKRARAGKPTIYRWWPTRVALLLDAYQLQKGDLGNPDTGNLEEDLHVFLWRLIKLWRDTVSGSIFRSLIAEAQSDAAAAEALKTYAIERIDYHVEIIERAKARGEVAPETDAALVLDGLVSYAWVRLLTDRLDIPESDVRALVRTVARGIARKA